MFAQIWEVHSNSVVLKIGNINPYTLFSLQKDFYASQNLNFFFKKSHKVFNQQPIERTNSLVGEQVLLTSHLEAAGRIFFFFFSLKNDLC